MAIDYVPPDATIVTSSIDALSLYIAEIHISSFSSRAPPNARALLEFSPSEALHLLIGDLGRPFVFC